MDEPLKLPKPPNPKDGWSGDAFAVDYNQVREYGLACARAALEEAAKVCEKRAVQRSREGEEDRCIELEEFAAAIRNLKVGE